MLLSAILIGAAFIAGVFTSPHIQLWIHGAEEELFRLRERALKLEQDIKTKLKG